MFSPDSDSSGDSPSLHNVNIRLSDIGKIDMYGNAKSTRFEIDAQTRENKSQLNAALRQIDGTPSRLEKAIDMEQRKSLFGKTSMQSNVNASASVSASGGRIKRAPPRPPVARGKDQSVTHVHKENMPPPVPPRPKHIGNHHVSVRRALEFHPVDYSTITSPDSIEKTR
jgi:hypothetical protein